MDKKQISLVVVVIFLISATAYMCRDWLGPEEIQIGSAIRPNRVPENEQKNLGPAVKRQPYTVSFFFNRKCVLQSVKVVRASEFETNRFAHPLWELLATAETPPVKSITYGVPIRGMHPEIKGAQADVLQPGVAYRLIIKTSNQEASHDFTLGRKPS